MDTNRHECVRSSSPACAFSAMVGMAHRAVPGRVAADGTNIRAILTFEEVAPLRAARISQRDVPTPFNTCARSASPEAMNVNSPGCNPGCGRFGRVPTPKGSNTILFSVSSIRPLRGRDLLADHYPGFHPGLFTLQPSGLPNRVNSWSVRGPFVIRNFLLTLN